MGACVLASGWVEEGGHGQGHQLRHAGGCKCVKEQGQAAGSVCISGCPRGRRQPCASPLATAFSGGVCNGGRVVGWETAMGKGHCTAQGQTYWYLTFLLPHIQDARSIKDQRESLPIFKLKQQLIEAVRDNQVRGGMCTVTWAWVSTWARHQQWRRTLCPHAAGNLSAAPPSCALPSCV